MKISYDPEVDALSITFRDTTVTTKHLAEGIAADYDSEGRLAGLEILDAQKRFGGPDAIRRVELEGVANAEVIIDEWIETARNLGRPIPEPRGKSHTHRFPNSQQPACRAVHL